MKSKLFAGLVALSLSFSAHAFAKDIPSVDLVSGDYVGVAGVELDQLGTRDIFASINEAVRSEKSLAKALSQVESLGYDVSKDIDLVLVFIPADVDKSSSYVVIVEAKKSLKALEGSFAKDPRFDARQHEGSTYFAVKSTNDVYAVIDDKRMVIGSDREVRGILETLKTGTAKKPLKSNTALFKQYQAVDKKKDIWVAYVLTSKHRDKLKSVQLDGADGKAFKASEMEAGQATIHFASGLEINLSAKMKSDASAKGSAEVLGTTLQALLGDQAMSDLGLGFLAKAVKITSSKSTLAAVIKLSKSELESVMALLGELGKSL
ncbi:MAG: hypothetical protein FWC40_09240 [Proteobacteria bacterium]|nr:hypothetical protein [Pseudomonadota bacterium]